MTVAIGAPLALINWAVVIGSAALLFPGLFLSLPPISDKVMEKKSWAQRMFLPAYFSDSKFVDKKIHVNKWNFLVHGVIFIVWMLLYFLFVEQFSMLGATSL